ncbi:MAG TPA: hypothetical protein VIF34_13075 [Methylocystis sp.]
MRSKHAPLLVAAGLVASINTAAAVPAIVWASAPLHALPSSRSARLDRIPALAAVEVGPCRDWCRVQFGAVVGFVPSRLLVATAGARSGYYGSAGYGAGPFGLLTAPFQSVGGVFGGAAYGAACPASPVAAVC